MGQKRFPPLHARKGEKNHEGKNNSKSYRIYGSILPPSNSGHMEFLGHGVASCELSCLCRCTIVSCPLPTDQGAMTPGRGSMRCCSDLKIQDDAIRSKGEATYPTRSAITLCAPDRIVLPEPYILHDPSFPFHPL